MPDFFAAATNEVVFDSVYSSLAIVKADPSLCALLDRHAANYWRGTLAKILWSSESER
jgi:hypothetical protein